MSRYTFDVCEKCGHYRGEHDATGCTCEIVRATGSVVCACDGFTSVPLPECEPRSTGRGEP